MFALQHFILPKVIGCLFHLHLYLFNSQKRIYQKTKKEVSKDKKGSIKKQKRKYQKTKKEVSKYRKGGIKIQKRRYQNTEKEVSKYRKGSIKRQKRKYQNTKKEISKYKKGNIKIQKRKYQNTKKRNKQTTLFFFKRNPLISFISIYKLFYSYTSSIPNSSKPVSVLAHGSKCGGRLNVASLS